MNLPGFSVRRPVFTTMVTLIIVILGAVSLARLRIDMLPAIELPTLSVRTAYQGASPEVMESLVTQIIEEIIATTPGVEEITSVSSEGSSEVSVTFVWGTDIDIAATDVRSRLEDELSELPEGIERPQIRKFDVASFPVVLLGISSPMDPVELTRLIEDQIRYRFARMPGVAQVDMWGGFDRELRVELDPARLQALELSLDTVTEAIRDANVDLPAGEIDRGRLQLTLRAPAEFQNVDQMRSTVVATRDGAAITLGQIGTVQDTYQRLDRIIRVNGERGVRVAIRKQADANTVEVARAILDEVEAINLDYPQINVVPVLNQGNFIERSIANVARSVAYGGALAVLVLVFFLFNLRSTLVIGLAIPTSMVATFALIYFSGFTINLMTLGGLALGVGMMVDNSIVVLENIFRRRDEDQEAPDTAAVEGAREVGPAIVASTITTLVIFLPLVFVQGIAGLLFREMAFTIVFALGASLLVALSLVPMLASRLVRAPDEIEGKGGWWARMAHRSRVIYDDAGVAYRDLLHRVLRHRGLTLLVAAAITGASALLLPLLGSEFLPPSDEGEVRVTGEMEIGVRLDLLDDMTRRMEALVFPAVPEAVASVTTAGSSPRRPDQASNGEIQISLTPAGERTRSNSEIARALRTLLEGQLPGMTIRTRAPQGQFLLERLLGGEEGLRVEARGFDFETLDRLIAEAAEVIAEVPGVTDVDVTRGEGIPQARIEVDRAKAASLGVSVRDVTEVLQVAVAGRQVGEYRTEGNSYRIFVQLADVRNQELDTILSLTVQTQDGDAVPLRNLVTTEQARGPLLVDRKDQQRVASLEANVAGRDMGSVAADVRAKLREIPKPLGYELRLSGSVEEQEEAFDELLISMVLALLLVYMVLAAQYESFRDPIVVMLAVPVAGVGVLLTLWLTHTTLNVQSYIGCIMLGGIVVNNSILLVDQAGALRREGLSVDAAAAEAGRRRLRPILMTTLTTILGLLPLAFGVGEGADAQAPLARAVVGGLTGSTLITLVLIPAMYSLFHPEKGGADAQDDAAATQG